MFDNFALPEVFHLRRENVVLGGGIAIAGIILSLFLPPIGAMVAFLGGAAVMLPDSSSRPTEPEQPKP